MKQPAAILVLPVLYTILVLPLLYQNLPVSAILENTGYCQHMSIADTGRFWEILVIPVLQILEDSGKYWLYQYCRYWKILENTGYTSITDTGRFWKILVIPILQILADYLRICGMYLYIVFFTVCASVMSVCNTDLRNLAYNVCI